MVDFGDFLDSIDIEKIAYDLSHAGGEWVNKPQQIDDFGSLYKLSTHTTVAVITAYLRAYHNWMVENRLLCENTPE